MSPGPAAVPDAVDAVQARDDGAGHEGREGREERPQIRFAAVAERVHLVGRPRAAPQGDAQQHLRDGVRERVRRLRQHRRRTTDHGADRLGQRDEQVRQPGHEDGQDAVARVPRRLRLLRCLAVHGVRHVRHVIGALAVRASVHRREGTGRGTVGGVPRLLIVADTHVPKRARDLPAALWAEVDRADVVVHAGDWVDVALLDALLERLARRPCTAPRARRGVRQQRRAGVAVAPARGGPCRPRWPSLRGGARDRPGTGTGDARWTPPAASPALNAPVFGHSHIPWDTTAPAACDCSTPVPRPTAAVSPTARTSLRRPGRAPSVT